MKTQNETIEFLEAIRIVKSLALYSESLWTDYKGEHFKQGYKEVSSELIQEARSFCIKNGINF